MSATRLAQQRAEEIEALIKERNAAQAEQQALKREMTKLRGEVEFLSLFPTSADATAILEERRRAEAAKQQRSPGRDSGGGGSGGRSPEQSSSPRAMRAGGGLSMALGGAVLDVMKAKGLVAHSHLSPAGRA